MTLPNRPPIFPPIIPPFRPVPGNTPPAAPSAGAITLASNFIVLINGKPIACARVATLELAADTSQLERRDLPGPPPHVLWSAPAAAGRLVLARALDGDRTLYQWRRDAIDGKPGVRQIEVQHLSHAGGEVLHRFSASDCWPVRWTGPRYDAFTGEIAFEELEVVYADLHWL